MTTAKASFGETVSLPPSFREMVDQIKYESFIDLMVYVMEGFNLPIPDEGGLLYKLKAIGLKVGK